MGDSPATMTPATPLPAPAARAKPKRYVPAVGPLLKPVLWTVLLGFGALAATGAYLAGVSLLNYLRPGALYTTPFTFWMFLAHAAVGLLLSVPYFAFGIAHWVGSRKRTNRRAIRVGIALFLVGGVIVATGLALFQLEGLPQLPTGTITRSVVYWLHVLVPVGCAYLYVAHRKAGPKIRWKYGKRWGAVTAVAMVGMGALHGFDPRAAARKGSAEGEQYFHPSEARTADGKFIPAETLMNDEYCMRCHADVARDHLHSAHKFSSGNNPAYLASVNETREMGLKRDGSVRASRWCAGCHDPTPLFSGQFDDPNFDLGTHPTGHAGVTCTACHAITDVHGPTGNAAYTIEESQHYPFASSTDPVLSWVNGQMIKAKPEFHKKTFLKPLHKSAEFCSTCHKVALPVELNHYKDFLRGQNHYDSFVLSGMGNGARSFYFPERAKDNCNACHMPLQASTDFGAKDNDGSGARTVHHHSFPGANTGLAALLAQEPRYDHLREGWAKTTELNANYLKDKKLRIDLFGVKRFGDDGTPDDSSLAVLRPNLPKLIPGETYLVETVVRTLALGHHFSQGTVDSNEIWVDFEAKDAGGRVIGRNGATRDPDDAGPVDEWAHFINVHMLDRDGNRIDRRNPQDIFTPLYDKQTPPGAASVVHYRLNVPADVAGPVTLTARLRYRKFDDAYMNYVAKANDRPKPKLPVVDICTDTVTLPVGESSAKPQESPVQPAWQRWNDYGIGCLLEGGVGAKRGNLRQAEAAFRKLVALGVPAAQWHAHANTARVLMELGQLNEAAAEVAASAACDPPAPWWLRAWLSGVIASENATSGADLDAAAAHFARIVDPANRPRDAEGNYTHDFSKDYVVLGRLGQVLFKRSLGEADGSEAQRVTLGAAVAAYRKALAVDPEDLPSHYGIGQCYAKLAGDRDAAESPGEVTPSALGELLDADDMPGLAAAVGALGRKTPDATAPRLKALQAARKRLDERDAADPAVAFALAAVHRELHALFKPDELARARTVRLYRERHPAANAAAEAIVFYPTDPSGAGRR